MNDKVFKIILAVLALALAVAVIVSQGSNEERQTVGDEHEDQGSGHLQEGEHIEYGGDEPPTSGDHSTPIDKGAYNVELPDENTIHNLEHGYVYVSYQPGVSREDINKLEALFFSPYSNPDFSPTKVIMAPRAANKSPIILSSWQRSKTYESYDEQAFIDYYLANVNKSPEPTAQ